MSRADILQNSLDPTPHVVNIFNATFLTCSGGASDSNQTTFGRPSGGENVRDCFVEFKKRISLSLIGFLKKTKFVSKRSK